MSKHKFPDRLNWPDQSEFSSEDRNAVWDKIKHSEKKRSAKWLPYSLSAVAAAAAIFLIVQITGVEEQAPVDQPEEEVEVIEETVEELPEQPVESEKEQEIDMRELEPGDELHGWIVVEKVIPENNKGGSYVLFEKDFEMSGEIITDEKLQGWPTFNPDSFEEVSFPGNIEKGQISLSGRPEYYEKIFNFDKKSNKSIQLEFKAVLIDVDYKTGFPTSNATFITDFGPPYAQFDKNSIDENFNDLNNQDYIDLLTKVTNDSEELNDLTPLEIMSIIDSLPIEEQGMLFTNGKLLEEYNLMPEYPVDGNYMLASEALIEVILSEEQAYVATLNFDGSLDNKFNFKKEDGKWKIISLPIQ